MNEKSLIFEQTTELSNGHDKLLKKLTSQIDENKDYIDILYTSKESQEKRLGEVKDLVDTNLISIRDKLNNHLIEF